MPMDCAIRRVTAFCLTSLLLSGGVFALPTGGQVAQGSGSISQNGTNMSIDQNSQNMVINWNTFNIGNGESVAFHQPNSNAIALNRVTTQNASQILGNLSANGQVFVINPNGVIFGKGAQVRVGGLVASTRDISDHDFLSKNYHFSGLSAGSIVNNGEIDVSNGGYVALLGASVTNNGTVKAANGNVSMAAGKQITLQLNNDSLLGLTVDQGTLNAAVQNHGLIQANNGKVYLTAKAAQDLTSAVVNNDGEIDADGINTDGGTIKLIADGGTATTGGKISATGKHGGSVQVLADQHAGVMGGSIDVSGTNGGGSIRVGGGLHGTENNIQNASVSYIAKDAVLNADATDNGNGGSVVVWGNDGNNFYGHIFARGGKNGGNGGFVETSSHNGFNINGSVDAKASHGTAGSWVLDPYNVTINNIGGTAFANPFTAAADSTILASDIGSALTGGTNVFVYTNDAITGGSHGDITVNSAITASGTASLYLKAIGNIDINSAINAASSATALNVYLWGNFGGAVSDTTYTAGVCADCHINFGSAGSVSAGRGNVDLTTNGTVSLNASSTILNANQVTITGSSITANGKIQATTLTGATTLGAGSATFDNVNNDIQNLDAFLATGFTLTDSTALNVISAVGGVGGDTTIQTTSGNITLGSASAIAGNNITIASGNNFINNAGSSVFTLGTGRWLVWSKALANNTVGGLSPNFTQYDATYGVTTVTGSGNGFLFSSAAPVGLPIGNNAQNAAAQGQRSVIIEASEAVNAPVNSKGNVSRIPRRKKIKACRMS